MRICVFSGTTEGHELSRFLAANGVPAEVFVATEYGAAVMEPMPGITVHEGRLDENEIAARLDADTLLIDATHPYAALVTDNLRRARKRGRGTSGCSVRRCGTARVRPYPTRRPLSRGSADTPERCC